MDQETSLRKVRRLLIAFIVLLILSGITAFPLQWEISLMDHIVANFSPYNTLAIWYYKISQVVNETWNKYPFIAYGTDWLAFAHIVIAVAFIGPYRDPVKNIWVLEFGMISCLMIFPLAFIAGPIRGIPFFWQLIDCSFGIFGFLLLYYIYRIVKKM